MPIIYKTCAEDGIIPDYICNECGEAEGGRVRGAAYIHKSLKGEITKSNVELSTWWETQIEAGLIKVIPSTRGTFDGGTKKTVTGFGDEAEKIIGKTFVAVINDSNHSGNVPFYEALENNYKDYVFAFRTEKELRIATDVLIGLDVKDPIEEDVNSAVLWQATATWDQSRPKMLVPVYDLTDKVKELFTSCLSLD